MSTPIEVSIASKTDDNRQHSEQLAPIDERIRESVTSTTSTDNDISTSLDSNDLRNNGITFAPDPRKKRFSVNALKITESLAAKTDAEIPDDSLASRDRSDSEAEHGFFDWFGEDNQRAQENRNELDSFEGITKLDTILSENQRLVLEKEERREQSTSWFLTLLREYAVWLYTGCTVVLVLFVIDQLTYKMVPPSVSTVIILSSLTTILYLAIRQFAPSETIAKVSDYIDQAAPAISLWLASLLVIATFKDNNLDVSRPAICLFIFTTSYLMLRLGFSMTAARFKRLAYGKKMMQVQWRLCLLQYLEEQVKKQCYDSIFQPLSYNQADTDRLLENNENMSSSMEGNLSLATTMKRLSVNPEGFIRFERQIAPLLRPSQFDEHMKSKPGTRMLQKAYARLLYHHMIEHTEQNPSPQLTLNHFSKFFYDQSVAREAFEIFDNDQDGQISKSDFRFVVLDIYERQANLRRSLVDTGKALDSLLVIVSAVLCIILSFVFMWVYDLNLPQIIGLAVSITLSINMSVSEATKNVLLSMIFIFVNNVFNIGDQVIIMPGDEVVIVHKIDLHHTIFKRATGQHLLIPNFKLYSTNIANVSRAQEQWERFDFAVPVQALTQTFVTDLSDCIEIFLGNNPKHFYPMLKLQPIKRILSESSSSKPEDATKNLSMTLMIKCKPTDSPTKVIRRYALIQKFLSDVLQRITK